MSASESTNSGALRYGLGCSFPKLRSLVVQIVQDALEREGTVTRAAVRLDMSRVTLQRLLADYPELREPRQ